MVERVRAHRAQLIALFGASTHEADITEVQHPDDQPLTGPQPQVEKAAAPIVALRDDPKIDDEVRYEIRNWEQQLRLMGWSEERIWRRQFWPHSAQHPRGLPAVLEPGDHIRLADHEHLLIEKHDGSLLRFRKEG